VHKQLYFWIAVFWTIIVTFLCLTPSSNIPEVSILYLDKLIHIFFHFVFTTLWVLFFKVKMQSPNNYKPFFYSFVLSVFFGITIEILQEVLTTTRTADVFDVLANITGASLAIVVMILYFKNKK
jgi:VanZ family protein